MRGSGVSMILVVRIINVIRKSKKIKSKSQKFRTKKYKISFLFSGCYLVGSTSVGEPEVFDDGKINVPITMTYSNFERV